MDPLLSISVMEWRWNVSKPKPRTNTAQLDFTLHILFNNSPVVNKKYNTHYVKLSIPFHKFYYH